MSDNPFALLADSDSESDPVIEKYSDANQIPLPIRSNGGSLVSRLDPITRTNSTALGTDLFSDQNLDICCQIFDSLVDNIALLKLPKMKALKASLYPLVQQLSGQSNEITKDRRKKRKLVEFDDIAKIQKAKLEDMDKKYINQVHFSS